MSGIRISWKPNWAVTCLDCLGRGVIPTVATTIGEVCQQCQGKGWGRPLRGATPDQKEKRDEHV